MFPKSIIQLTENLKSLYIKTAKKLKGSNRRQFIAEVVKGLGIGGQTLVKRELGWNRCRSWKVVILQVFGHISAQYYINYQVFYSRSRLSEVHP
ncbi:MAG: hypothetical protein V7K41_27600 [Nostoc sp.]